MKLTQREERLQVLGAVKGGTTDLELSLVELSAYMDAEELTPGERRTLSSATLKMASAVMQLKNLLEKAKR